MIRTVIAEDSSLASNFFTQILEREGDFEIIASVSDAFEAERICAGTPVDLVLMDVMTEHNHSGLAAGRRIREASGKTRVVIVTSLVDPDVLAHAKAGAADSLWYKDHGSEDLISVIRRTLSGENIFPGSSPDIALGEMFSGEISPRQMQVLRCFVSGLTYDEIAGKLGITERGVRWYISELLDKGGFKNRHEMLSAILQSKLIVTTLLDSDDK